MKKVWLSERHCGARRRSGLDVLRAAETSKSQEAYGALESELKSIGAELETLKGEKEQLQAELQRVSKERDDGTEGAKGAERQCEDLKHQLEMLSIEKQEALKRAEEEKRLFEEQLQKAQDEKDEVAKKAAQEQQQQQQQQQQLQQRLKNARIDTSFAAALRFSDLSLTFCVQFDPCVEVVPTDGERVPVLTT
eukprot:1242958-Amphidinium_carterae.1